MTTATAFIGGLKGHGHSGYDRGVDWITTHGGVLVSARENTRGGILETYRVRFAGRDVLCTWGLGGVIDPHYGQFPDEWRVVTDRAK